MKFTTKMLININPSYLNHVKEDELNDEIIMYALEKGYDYRKDIEDRFSEYNFYVEYNFNKDETFLDYYIDSKHFDINNLDENMLKYIKSDNKIFLKCMIKNIDFIKNLDSTCNFTKDELNELFKILDNNNINYSELNESFLNNNFYLGLKYLDKNFSNIVNLKKYTSYKLYSNDILNIFMSNLEDNIVYLNEIGEFELDSDFKEKIIRCFIENPIIINEKTPKYIFENRYVIFSLLKHDLSNSNFIDREIYFHEDEINIIINKIRKENYIFDKIPVCFQNNIEIKKAIIYNNPILLENKNFEFFHGIYELALNLVTSGKYRLNLFTNSFIVEALCQDYLDVILDYDFSYLEFFDNLNVRFLGDQDNLFNVLKKHKYEIDGYIPICLQNNEKLIKYGLENNLLDINILDLINSSYSHEFKLYLINYCNNNNINNLIVKGWELLIVDKKMVNRDDVLYLKDNLIDFNLPNNIKEVHISNNNVDYINKVIDALKKSNNSVVKVIVDLNYNNLEYPYFSIEELNRIKHKDMVMFGSLKDKVRLSVYEMIESEQLLGLMVKDIRESNLSPYERYIAVYSLVKKFKEYKFYENDKEFDSKYQDQSRNVYLILNNDYIVCVGYAKLLETLLNRVGINSVTWDVESLKETHMRNYINIVDEKYNINGYYMSDPTWDSVKYSKDLDYYDYLNLTRDESRKDPDIKIDNNGKPILCDDMFDDRNDQEMLDYLNDIKNYNYFKKKISKLDPLFYEFIKDMSVDLKLASIVNDHFRSKVNKKIDENKEILAKFELNEYIYGASKSKEEKENRWNDYVISNHYSWDFLTKDYNSDINKFYEVIKNKSFKEYNELYDLSGAYDKACINEAYFKLKQDYLTNEGDIAFGFDFNKEKLIFSISIDNTLFNSDKMEYVLSTLKEKGYDVINEKNDRFVIMLDNSYIDKSFIELYQIANLIKQDYMEIYESIFVKENNKLGV